MLDITLGKEAFSAPFTSERRRGAGGVARLGRVRGRGEKGAVRQGASLPHARRTDAAPIAKKALRGGGKKEGRGEREVSGGGRMRSRRVGALKKNPGAP